jgi:hypothetical protein
MIPIGPECIELLMLVTHTFHVQIHGALCNMYVGKL